MHTKRMNPVPALVLALLAGWVMSAGCATTESDLVDKKLELLEKQFAGLEKHKISRGVGGDTPRSTSPEGLPVVKLRRAPSAPGDGGWSSGGGADRDEPEVRVAPGSRTPPRRYAKVQRPRRGVAGMDDAGNLVDEKPIPAESLLTLIREVLDRHKKH